MLTKSTLRLFTILSATLLLMYTATLDAPAQEDNLTIPSPSTVYIPLVTAPDPPPPPLSSLQVAYISFPMRSDGDPAQIVTMQADGTNITQLTNIPGDKYSLEWSPDGQWLSFDVNDGNSEIYVVTYDGLNLANLTNNPATDRSAVWSPNGSEIAFVSDRDGNPEIYVMNNNGDAQTNLTNDPGTDDWPVWSPDGTQIAFISSRTGTFGLYIMQSDGSNPVRLADAQGGGTWAWRGPSWSPDGRSIAYMLNGNIHVFNVDTQESLKVTSFDSFGSYSIGGINWSADSTDVAFSHSYNVIGNSTPNVYIVSADGTQSSARVMGGTSPKFSPGGEYIAANVVFRGTTSLAIEVYVTNLRTQETSAMTNGSANARLNTGVVWRPLSTRN
ncbi:hypothetical protein GC175_31240 [bacterium]|nr:hypothetical protein [bacterium]